MKKTGIAFSLLLLAGFFSFFSVAPRHNAALAPAKITQKMPASKPAKPSDEGQAKQSIEPDQPNGSWKTLPSDKLNDDKKSVKLTRLDNHSADQMFYTIQSGAFKNFRSAAVRALNLKSHGHNIFYNCETDSGKESWYKVYIDLFRSKEDALQKASILEASGVIADFLIKTITTTTPTGPDGCPPNEAAYFLHVSSFKDQMYANEEVQRLQKFGYKAAAILEIVDGKRWFRIYTGAFDSEESARMIGSELKQKGLTSYFKPLPLDKIIRSPKIADLKPIERPASPEKAEDAAAPAATKSPSPPPAQPEPPKPEDTAEEKKPELVINDITFSVKKGEKELVLFHANRYFSPAVRFNLKGKNPTIVIDLEPPAHVENLHPVLPVKRKWVKQIETQMDSSSKAIQIVLYLHASENYKVSQSFYKSEKIFAVKITAKKKTRKK